MQPTFRAAVTRSVPLGPLEAQLLVTQAAHLVCSTAKAGMKPTPTASWKPLKKELREVRPLASAEAPAQTVVLELVNESDSTIKYLALRRPLERLASLQFAGFFVRKFFWERPMIATDGQRVPEILGVGLLLVIA